MTIFLDASFLIALFNKDDDFHQKAQEITTQLERNDPIFIISNIVLAEAINVIFRTGGSRVASQFYSLIRSSNLKTFTVNEQVFSRALKFLFNQKAKKGLNFFDCLHLATAEILKIRKILTFDKDFKNTDIELVGNMI
jgi:predicted nucleic acid-binding protein